MLVVVMAGLGREGVGLLWASPEAELGLEGDVLKTPLFLSDVSFLLILPPLLCPCHLFLLAGPCSCLILLF